LQGTSGLLSLLYHHPPANLRFHLLSQTQQPKTVESHRQNLPKAITQSHCIPVKFLVRTPFLYVFHLGCFSYQVLRLFYHFLLIIIIVGLALHSFSCSVLSVLLEKNP
jgi:hypothetical protein